MTKLHSTPRALAALLLGLALLGWSAPATAIDGGTISGMALSSPESTTSPSPSYYEATIGGLAADERESSDPGLPSALHFSDSTARVAYTLDHGPL